MKKALSILLCIVMLLSVVPMAAVAAGEDLTLTVTADVTAPKAGDTVVFTIAVSPVTKAMGSIGFKITIPDGLTYVSYAFTTEATTAWSLTTSGQLASFGEDAKLLGAMGLTYTSASAMDVMTITCTVANDAPVGEAMTVTLANAEAFAADDDDTELTVGVVGVDVTVPAELESLYMSSANTLAVNGDNDPATLTLTASATGTDGQPMTTPDDVTFSLVGTAPTGVTLTGNKLSVTHKFTGTSVQVKAASGSIESDPQTITINVAEAVPAGATFTVSGATVTKGNDGNSTANVVKAQDADNAKTYTITAAALDQYGEDNAAELTLTAGALPGTSFADGVLTVTNEATVDGTVTVTAKSGETTVATLTLTVIDKQDAGVELAESTPTTKTYGDAPFAISATAKAVTNADAAGWTYSSDNAAAIKYDEATKKFVIVAPGTATLTAKYEDDDYMGTDEVEITVAKKTVTVTVDDVTAYIGCDVAEVENSFSITHTELVGEDDVDESGATYAVYALDEDGNKTDTDKTGAWVPEEAAEYAITVTGLTVDTDKYELAEPVDGTLTVRRKSSTPPAYGTGTPAPGTVVEPTKPADDIEFNDVAEGDWFYDAVMFCAKEGLMTGTGDKVFSPAQNTTRAMIATIIWRDAGSPAARARIADFPDVQDGAWYADAVRWCAEQEIVTGFEDGTFGPNETVTREQMVTMFHRYATKTEMDVTATAELGTFADGESVGTWAAPSVEWAVGAGLIKGKDGNMLDPQGLATRAEVATILQRFVGLKK